MSNQKEVQQAVAAAFAPIFTTLANSADNMTAKQHEFLVGSAVLGIANRAAYGFQNAEQNIERITRVALALIESDGIEKSGAELRKLDDDANFWRDQVPEYEALYAACKKTWFTLKGTPMPDQWTKKRAVGKTDDRNAHSIAQRFGAKTDAVPTPPAKTTRKRAAK